MNKTSTGFRISSVVLSLLMFIFLSGLLPVAVIAYKKGTKFNTAKVQVQAAADELYSAALGIIYDDPAIELRKKDDVVNRIVEMTVEIAKMKDILKARKKELEGLVADYRLTLLEDGQQVINPEE